MTIQAMTATAKRCRGRSHTRSPNRARARAHAVLWHGSQVSILTVRAGGTLTITGGNDECVRVWDTARRAQVGKLRASSWVCSAAFISDDLAAVPPSTVMAPYSFGPIQLWPYIVMALYSRRGAPVNQGMHGSTQLNSHALLNSARRSSHVQLDSTQLACSTQLILHAQHDSTQLACLAQLNSTRMLGSAQLNSHAQPDSPQPAGPRARVLLRKCARMQGGAQRWRAAVGSISDNFFRCTPTARAKGLGRVVGWLQIDTGPRRSPSACSEAFKKKHMQGGVARWRAAVAASRLGRHGATVRCMRCVALHALRACVRAVIEASRAAMQHPMSAAPTA